MTKENVRLLPLWKLPTFHLREYAYTFRIICSANIHKKTILCKFDKNQDHKIRILLRKTSLSIEDTQ